MPGVVVTNGVTPRGERTLHVLDPTGYAATIQVDLDDPTGLLTQPLAVPARTGAMLDLPGGGTIVSSNPEVAEQAEDRLRFAPGPGGDTQVWLRTDRTVIATHTQVEGDLTVITGPAGAAFGHRLLLNRLNHRTRGAIMLTTDNLSVQLYTVREAAADDLDAVLERLAQIGFRLVEPFGLLDFAPQLATSLPRHGLTAPTTHAAFVGQDQDQVFGTAADLGIQIVVEPAVRDDRWTDEDAIKRIADDLNAAAELAARHGVLVGYHNHWWELAEIGDALGLEVLARNLSPEVVLEVDTYWAYTSGADVPALVTRLGDRVVALHLKDGDGSRDVMKQVAVGAGSVPVWDFVDAATNLQYGVVELDDSAGDRFTALADSFAYVTSGSRS